jgi:hypothetical protein
MKRISTVFAAVLIIANMFLPGRQASAQLPEKISYQAVIRNASNQLVINTQIGIEINILQGSESGSVVYTETQTPTTNANGLVSIEIGGGAGFSSIDWAGDSYFIETKIAIVAPLTTYTITGVSQLLSVPYALRAKTAESITGTITESQISDLSHFSNADESDPVFTDSQASNITATDITNLGNLSGSNTGDQDISGISTNATAISDETTRATTAEGALTTSIAANTSAISTIQGEQTTQDAAISLNTAKTGITAVQAGEITANTAKVGLSAAQVIVLENTSGTNTGDQELSISIDTIYLSEGGFVKLPAGFDGNYNSLTDKPENVSTFTNDAGYLTLFTDEDGSVTNELQTLSISHDTIALSINGGKVKLPNVVSNVHITHDTLFITYSNGQIIPAGYVGYGSPGSSLPSVVTESVTDLNYTSTSINGNITNNGEEFILSRGVCLSKNAMPDLNDTVYVSGNGSGSFSTNCNQLAFNTTYYVRAFATNTVGTTYGNELSFTTKAITVPTISTQNVSAITNTTAILEGNITDDGGTPILERGICWSLNSNPTTDNNFITEGIGAGSYLALMTGLLSNTLYHVRAYATNAQGTSYGEDLSFTTIVLPLASITTNASSNVSYTTATSGGNVTNDNGSSVIGRGICWATTPSPTTANSNYSEAGGLGTFTAGMTGLTPNTLYYIRAFAINGGGTSYGNEVSFTTLTTSVPSLTTKSISGISSNLAGSGGTISTDGGSDIIAKGVCWSINPTPTIDNNKTNDGTGLASYNSTMTDLIPLTQYYVRAYATNGFGISYGGEVSFITTDLINPGPTVPAVGTSLSAITGSSTASSGGYVSSDGGSTVSVRGICWSLSPNPTLADSSTTDGGGLGYFTSTITGLSGCGTIYYIKAYATNSTGTGYGNQNTVSTGLLPTATTDEASDIGFYTAVSGGSITDDGGCPITQKGVCWSYYPNPTSGYPHTSEGPGSGAFISNITGLDPNRTYYVKTYATNSVGTSYGPEKVFTTATPPTPYIGQNYAGGIVFYIDGTGQHGLVCAPANQGYLPWGCAGTEISGTGTAMGTGPLNTAAIVASCGEAGIAARVCDDLVLNGYNDWFLPSKDELYFMYLNLHAHALGGFDNYGYWSSSEYNLYSAIVLYFNGGFYENRPRDEWQQFSVRAVRAF